MVSTTLRHRVTVHKQQIRNASRRILIIEPGTSLQNLNKKLPLYKMQKDNAAVGKMKRNIKPKLDRRT